MASWLDAAADEIDPDRPNLSGGRVYDYNGKSKPIDFGITDPKSWREYVELITPVLDEAAEALAEYHAENDRKVHTRLRRAWRALRGEL